MMKPVTSALVAFLLAPLCALADARLGTSEGQGERRLNAFNPIPDWIDLALEWVGQSERGPTISGHFLAMTNVALYDTWAAYESGTTGALTDLESIRVSATAFDAGQKPALVRERSQVYAMTLAAYEIVSNLMGPTMIGQEYLELEEAVPEIAEDRLAELKAKALELRDAQTKFEIRGLSAADRALMEAVAGPVYLAVRDAIQNRINNDGSNWQGDYKDVTSGYEISSWVEPSPCKAYCFPGDGISNTTKDYDFTSEIYSYNTFDVRTASNYYAGLAEPPSQQIHPLVLDRKLQLTETWQSLSQTGVFPGAKDGGEQFPLTPHWGGVTPFTLVSGSDLRSEYVGPYDKTGNLREEWVNELQQLLDLSELQQAGTCPRCRAESEYWELGDEFKYPPGWWIERANEIVRELGLPIRESLQISLGVSLAVFDSGIAAWEMKYHYDSVRPVTAINELFYGSKVSDWTGVTTGNKVANIDERNFWRPYQLRRNSSPPFPDVPSGHSTFSKSAEVVLRLLLRTNVFDFVSEPFLCRFDTAGGFDGDASNGNEYTTLDFKTLSQASDAAGFSRLLGGIHMMQGNLVGFEMGTKVGHATVSHLRDLFGEDVGDDPVDDVHDEGHLLFGTGGNDAVSVPCNPVGLTEAFGYYGDDTLEFIGGVDCGSVHLFGGSGADIFRVGTIATIQDYEPEDTIELVQAAGTLSRDIIGAKTIVNVNGSPAVILDGEHELLDLNILFVTATTDGTGTKTKEAGGDGSADTATTEAGGDGSADTVFT